MTRSSCRARTSERGFVLLAALVLAVLYFGLMELLLIDSARELNEAQRFAARTVAAALAENGAELAAQNIVTTLQRSVNATHAQGSIVAKMTRTGQMNGAGTFEIESEGETTGVLAQRASVKVQGRITKCDPRCQLAIDYTFHSQ